MPELPEVEVLVRHLAGVVAGKTIRSVAVKDARSLRHCSPGKFKRALNGARFQHVQRRGKYLVFTMRRQRRSFPLIGHLGMTGRMYLTAKDTSPSRHTTLEFELGPQKLVFEDVRRFGGMTLDSSAVNQLGPEPLAPEFTIENFRQTLTISRQAIKIKLLDQKVVAGIGNIYASEALFLAGIHPGMPANQLSQIDIQKLRSSIRRVLRDAIQFGSTVPLDFGHGASKDRLFYYGQSAGGSGSYREHLRVYDRDGEPCVHCGSTLLRIVQAARSTFFCAKCQTVAEARKERAGFPAKPTL